MPQEPDIEAVVKGLTQAQRDALIAARWFHPGGHDPFCVVEFTSAWPKGMAEFFTMKTDRLTPFGQRVAAYLKEQSND